MKLLYPLVTLIVFSSCATRLHYIGNSLPASQQVDVYVDASAVPKPYTIMGKGYIGHSDLASDRYIRKIQSLAVAKAKQKGADAVLIQDYFTAPAADLNTVLQTDSNGKGTVTIGKTTVQKHDEQNFAVLFLKYRK